jgi:hypothetical protein
MAVLVAIWLWFASVFGGVACLDAPTFSLVRDVPGSVASYRPPGDIRVESWLRLQPARLRVVATHELTHHHWYECRIAQRRVGDRFLRLAGQPAWTREAKEEWASTLTWVLTGWDDGYGLVQRPAARVFRNLIDNPTAAMRQRMGL